LSNLLKWILKICVCVQPGETEDNIAGRIARGGQLSERGEQVLNACALE